jgi:hypothetical protein
MSCTHWLSRCIVGTLGAVAVACAYPEFQSSSHVGELRILGLQSDHAVAEPGASISMSALWADGRNREPTGVTRAWFKGCTNPALDSVFECTKQLNHQGPTNADGWPSSLIPVFSDQARFHVAEDALVGRDGFGIEFYFFAACQGGTLSYQPSNDEVFPVACRDEAGTPIDPSNFTVGYRAVLVIAGIPQLGHNPLIESIEIGVDRFEPDCLDSNCIGTTWPDCNVDQCAPVRACEKSACEPANVMVRVNEASAELDWIASAQGAQTERLWARYFVDQGAVEPALQILHEPNGAWRTQAESQLLVPASSTRLWAVVYDSTGGVSWAGLSLRAR